MLYIDDFVEDKENEWTLYNYFVSAKKEDVPIEIKDAIDYLSQRANFCYTHDYLQDNPFEQLFSFNNGYQSIKVSDLEESDIKKLLSIIPLTNNPFLRAKIYDILGVICGTNKDYKHSAADNYYKYITTNLRSVNNNHILYIALQRALYLYSKIQCSDINNIVKDVFENFNYKDNEQELVFKYYTTTALYKIKSQIVSKLVPHIEKICADYIKENIEIYLELLDILISHYNSIHNGAKFIFYVEKYVSFCEQANTDYSPHGYKYLEKALSLISKDNLIDKYNDKISDLLFKIEEEHQKLYNNMSFVEAPIKDDLEKFLNQQSDRIVEHIKKFNLGLHQFIFLLSSFKPITRKEVDNHIEINKNSILSCVNDILFDENKNIIFESSKATKEEIKEKGISGAINLDLNLKFGVILRHFIYNLKLDESLKTSIKDLLTNNLFVPKDRVDVVYQIILKGMNRKIREAIYDLIAQFEYGCKMFLRNRKIYPVTFINKRRKDLDLNHILSSKAKNKFRDEISNIIGEDLTLSIEFLSIRKLSGNLRNKNYHTGYGNPEEFSIHEAALFYYLMEAYCLACEG